MRTVTQLGGCADSEQNSRSLWRERGSLADRDEERQRKDGGQNPWGGKEEGGGMEVGALGVHTRGGT